MPKTAKKGRILKGSTQIYSLGTNLIYQKVVNSYYIQTDFDSFDGTFIIAYHTRPYVFRSWESQIDVKASSYTIKHKNIP